jgi:hypothetical protein
MPRVAVMTGVLSRPSLIFYICVLAAPPLNVTMSIFFEFSASNSLEGLIPVTD